ncbi:MAG: hypothetical protein GY869_06135 [Planctomycetes bacterium]|nr:hypothetical protein [Planctomycetota bacterium]
MSILECCHQDLAINRLQRARRAERVPHGYIFHGPEGVGKGLLARQWAKLLLCKNPVKKVDGGEGGFEDCCDACDDCHLVEAGSHPDLHLISRQLGRLLGSKRSQSSSAVSAENNNQEKEGGKAKSKKNEKPMLELPIDVIRDFVIDQAGIFPGRGRARVFIIDEAEKMNRYAQNALLKTLEEPPAHTYIILLTSKLYYFLPTIRSRCHAVRLGGLPKEFIYSKLCDLGADKRTGAFWADYSGGRLGWAITLLKLGVYDKKCELVERLSQLSYASVLELSKWLQDAAKEFGVNWKEERPEDSDGASVRRGYTFWLEMMAYIFNLALRDGVDLGVGRATGVDQTAATGQIGERFGIWSCSEAIRATYRAIGRLESNVNAGLLLESLLLQYLECTDFG